MNEQTYTIHTDGGARGNPGPAAIGAIIEGSTLEKKEYGQYIGETTNNVAEYKAVAFALHKLKALIGSEQSKKSVVHVMTDSEFLVKQLNGEYKVKEPTMQEFFLEIWNLRLDFGRITFAHVPREKNSEADHMVNWALDQQEDRLL